MTADELALVIVFVVTGVVLGSIVAFIRLRNRR